MQVIKSLATIASFLLLSSVTLSAPIPTRSDDTLSLRDVYDSSIEARSSDAGFWERDLDELHLWEREPVFPEIKLEARGKDKKPPPTPATPVVPSVDEIKKHLKVDKDTCLFYSGAPPDGSKPGPGGLVDAEKWQKKNKGYKIIGQMWIDKFADKYQRPPEVYKAFWDNASEAMASMCTGTVYVMLPPSTQAGGKDWFAGSVWARKEWPALGKTKAKVIRVDPAGKEIVIKAS